MFLLVTLAIKNWHQQFDNAVQERYRWRVLGSNTAEDRAVPWSSVQYNRASVPSRAVEE